MDEKALLEQCLSGEALQKCFGGIKVLGKQMEIVRAQSDSIQVKSSKAMFELHTATYELAASTFIDFALCTIFLIVVGILLFLRWKKTMNRMNKLIELQNNTVLELKKMEKELSEFQGEEGSLKFGGIEEIKLNNRFGKFGWGIVGATVLYWILSLLITF
jgi:hypothetical protein